ncbi:hypothetical protein ABFS83_08G167800 [Erythranthe nasuta]
MKFSGLIRVCLVVFSILLFENKLGFAQDNGNIKNYITWDDLIVNDKRFHSTVDGVNQKAFIVVDKNGGGDSVTVQGAVDMVPENNAQRVKIHILPGVYSEKVHIPKSKPYISLIGYPKRASTTVITWHDKASDSDNNGGLVGTWNSATVAVESDYFCASGVTFQNTVVPKQIGVDGYQAVALRISGNKAMFYKTRFLGSQDTLLDEIGTHYYYKCFIQGSIDFIFGNARSLYTECMISVVGNAYAITAQGRNSASENTGFSFVNCKIRGNGPILLGRAWGDYSRVIFSYSEIDLHVRAQGWDDWGSPSRQKSVLFGEYKCRGRGANRSGRVGWSKELNDIEAKPFLDTNFLSGDLWLRL